MAFNETSLSFSRFEGRLFIFSIFPHRPSSRVRVAKRKGLGSLVVSVTGTGLGRRRGGGGWAAGRPCSLVGLPWGCRQLLPSPGAFLPPGALPTCPGCSAPAGCGFWGRTRPLARSRLAVACGVTLAFLCVHNDLCPFLPPFGLILIGWASSFRPCPSKTLSFGLFLTASS